MKRERFWLEFRKELTPTRHRSHRNFAARGKLVDNQDACWCGPTAVRGGRRQRLDDFEESKSIISSPSTVDVVRRLFRGIGGGGDIAYVLD